MLQDLCWLHSRARAVCDGGIYSFDSFAHSTYIRACVRACTRLDLCGWVCVGVSRKVLARTFLSRQRVVGQGSYDVTADVLSPTAFCARACVCVCCRPRQHADSFSSSALRFPITPSHRALSYKIWRQLSPYTGAQAPRSAIQSVAKKLCPPLYFLFVFLFVCMFCLLV